MKALQNVTQTDKEYGKEAERAWKFITTTDEPLEALAALRGFRTVTLDFLESALAVEARESGETWEAIGEALGISRQAAWEQYAMAPTNP